MVFQNDILAGASGTAVGYTIDQSIRFNSADSSYLSRTPSSNPTGGDASGAKQFTVSVWLKRGKLSVAQAVFAADASVNSTMSVQLAGASGSTLADQIDFDQESGGSPRDRMITSSLYRDVSAWYHFCLMVDTTQATAADRFKIAINGVLVSNWYTNDPPALNAYFQWNKNGVLQRIGSNAHNVGNLFDGYMAEFHNIDGVAAETDFGEYNDDGVWVPKRYAGTYGNNGFYITGANSADLGADESGNGNDFTSSGLTSDDQVSDSPTDNFATLNPLQPVSSNNTFSEGNLQSTTNTSDKGNHFSTLGMAEGKYYAECTILVEVGGASAMIGISADQATVMITATNGIGSASGSIGYQDGGDLKDEGSTTVSWGDSYTTNDVIGIAYDADTGNVWFSKNGVWQGSGDPDTLTSPAATLNDTSLPVFFAGGDQSNATSETLSWNFGQLGFTYTPPTNFSALSTANLPEPTIKDGSAYFQASLYTGNGTAIGSGGKSVTQDKNSTFQPDFVWIKERNGSADHALYDAVRGTTKDLATNNSNAETTETEGLTAFDAAGFKVGNLAKVNTSSDTYVAWQWLAANGTSSNTVGSITSTISENTTSGLSIVTYTGDGNDNATVGHGLGVTPKTVWLLPRSNGDNKQVSNWETGVTAFTEDLKLNAAEVANSSSNRVKGGSSTTFTLGTDPNVNGSGNTYLAYVWNEVAGFSKFATYTSNGSTNGPFVYCGFRPAVVFIRCTENGENWHVYDSTRNEYNATNLFLYPTTADSEQSSGRDIDILSNGFKLRGTDGGINSASNRKYIAMCFAENPFGGNGVAPATAR